MLYNSVALFSFAGSISVTRALAPLCAVYAFGLLRAKSPLDANGVEILAAPQNYVEPDEQQ